MARKDRSDQTVGSHEKKHGLPPGTGRNPDGRDTRSDKEIGTIRKEGEKKNRASNNRVEATRTSRVLLIRGVRRTQRHTPMDNQYE